jgi:hypothetical protein
MGRRKAMKENHLARWVAVLLALAIPFTQGCSSGGSSEEKERVYGTPVSPDQFFPPESLSKEAKVAKCLTSKGTVLYGSAGCPVTVKQKALFKDGLRYLDYVECPEEKRVCDDKNIRAYPTWIIGRTRMSGSYAVDTLAEIGGCP